MLVELERRFGKAVSTSNISLAYDVVAEIKSATFSDATVAYFESYLLQMQRPTCKSLALAIVMDGVVRAGIDDIVLLVKGVTNATQLAMKTNDTSTMRELRAVADEIFLQHKHNPEVMRWQATVELNVGIHLYHNRKYHDALAQFDAMIVHFKGDVAYICQLTQAHAYKAIITALLGDVTGAASSLDEAERLAMPTDDAICAYARGVIAYKRGDVDAATHFQHAFNCAKSLTIRDACVMFFAKLRLAEMYRDSGQTELLAVTVELLDELIVNDGMPHLRDAVAEFKGVPIK